MRKRAAVLLAAAIVVVAGAIIFLVVLSRQRVRRHRIFRVAERPIQRPPLLPPVERWTEIFSGLPADDLADLLETIEQRQPDLYARYSLGYLHARALIENNDLDDAARKLAPFLQPSSPFRDLALYHQSEIEEGAAASARRQELIFEYGRSIYREQAIEEEAEYLSSQPQALTAFVEWVTFALDTAKRRELKARLATDLATGMSLLEAGTSDDAAERVARALDRPDLVRLMTPAQRALLGEAMLAHRHFDRAIALLSSALAAPLPAPKRDELQYFLGRSYFGAEDFVPAQNTYLRGASATADPKMKATFLWHAARAAQLRGDDATAERLMTATIAVPGTFPATTPALNQRIRTRLEQKRFTEATADLQLLRKIAPNDHALVEGSLAYALGMLGAGNAAATVAALNAVPRKLLDKDDLAEFAFWRARALGKTDPPGAPDLQRLASRYRVTPAYRAILELQPEPLPAFPLEDPSDRTALLLAMGLYDEATDGVRQRYPLTSPHSALTRSLALNRGNAARESIYAAEVVMKSVPADFVPELLPPLLRQLLYPRYFYPYVVEDAKKYNADPTLVLSIMREESRFNPRAKSAAAARGLLQFIITTARDIGRDIGMVALEPEDLYDPRVIIKLGAKYVAELSKQLDGNRYRVAAAYNAGPKQVALWSRLAPAPGDDFFVSAITFDETRHYVRTVMNSYKQYEQIYGGATLVPPTAQIPRSSSE